MAAGWPADGLRKRARPGHAGVRVTCEALAPFTADSVYVNYMADDDNARVRAPYGPCWDKLQQVKRKYDPDNVLHLNQNVTAA